MSGGVETGNLASQEGQTNSKTRESPDFLRQRGASRDRVGVNLGDEAEQFLRHLLVETSQFSSGDTTPREGKGLAHVTQDVLGTELWTLSPRPNNVYVLS